MLLKLPKVGLEFGKEEIKLYNSVFLTRVRIQQMRT